MNFAIVEQVGLKLTIFQLSLISIILTSSCKKVPLAMIITLFACALLGYKVMKAPILAALLRMRYPPFSTVMNAQHVVNTVY